ncbi:hypothetical protein LCGC14_2369670 [marine sediment metagenome]|uniref:Uncharacterized protein n=1 Tax=marine sediment metagenome TaxID=412755 RepID=A0A0F9EGN0_9ZZZZ
MAKNAVVVYGPFNVPSTTAATEIKTALELIDYSATIEWVVVGPNTRGIFYILSIDTA